MRRRLFRLPTRGARLSAELREELETHIALCVDRLVARGVPPERALAEARARFGDFDRALDTLDHSVHDRERRMHRRDVLDGIRQDLRAGLRHLLRARAFTAVVVLTLGLGIGATTAIFTVVRAVLLRDLPFPEPDRLVRVWLAKPSDDDRRGKLSIPDADDLGRSSRSLEHFAAYSTLPTGLAIAEGGEPTRLRTAFVSEDFFRTLGVRPALGRAILPAEHGEGHDRVLVISHALWRSRFGGDSAVVGRAFRVNDEPFTLVGVMPPSMRFPDDVEAWTPLSVVPATGIPRTRGVHWLDAVGRLRAGVTPARARADLAVIATRLAGEYGDSNGGWTDATVVPLRDSIVGAVRGRLLVLFGAVALVLLLACANVANLVLARGTLRARDLAVRTALGAGRGRLLRQLVVESLLTALAGGALGIALAWLGAERLVALTSAWLPPTGPVRPDWLVLAFALALSALTGLGFGLGPAARSLEGVTEALREAGGGRGASAGARAQTLRGAFVAAEVALAVVLVAGAGLFMKSFARLTRVDLGFDVEHTLYARVTIPGTRHRTPADYLPVATRMLEQVRAIPGVVAAGAAKDAPLRSGGAGEGSTFAIPSRGATGPGGREPGASFLPVTPGYLRALGIGLRAGRDLVDQDGDSATAAVLVSETAARANWPSRDPRSVVGEEIVVNHLRFRVVGIAADARYVRADSGPWPAVYVPQRLVARRIVTFVARTTGDPARLVPALRAAIRAVEPDQPISEIGTMRDAAADAVAAPRFLTVLVGLFGAVALLLATLGVYSVVAYVVGQRTRDIGVRIALGASRRDVAVWTLRTGMAPVAAGLALGTAAALALARLLTAQLYDVRPADPPVFASVVALLALVSLLASGVPARRAARIGPLEALRGD